MAVGEYRACPSDSASHGAFSRTAGCSCSFLYSMCYEKHLLDAKTLGSHMVLLNGLASLGINLDFLGG